MTFIKTPIADLYIFQSNNREDDRGSFMRLYCASSQEKEGIGARTPVQINYSSTKNRGVIRGLHFQRHPALESKMVRCLQGRILDVAVDLRKNSPTFLQHVAVELEAGDGKALMIPEGFAHGFQTLTEDCTVLYLHGTAYSPENEGGIPYNDPALSIAWPLDVTFLSDRDQSFAPITPHFQGIN